ncbi:MAG TPA: hypothetical protein VF721_15640 [Pyrinomonadaceae bacterium]|jgi:hypothetical protein
MKDASENTATAFTPVSLRKTGVETVNKNAKHEIFQLKELTKTNGDIHSKKDLLSPSQISKTKLERELQRNLRIKREVKILANLTDKERLIIEEALKILEEKQSVWLTYLFKYASSVRGDEIARDYNDSKRSFEIKGKAWYEVWNEQGKKIYLTINDSLPDFFRDWIDKLGKRRKDLKAN